MSEIIQQKSSIKFCVRNQISGAETFKMLQKAFGDNCMSRASVFDWYKLFKEGRERVDDDFQVNDKEVKETKKRGRPIGKVEKKIEKEDENSELVIKRGCRRPKKSLNKKPKAVPLRRGRGRPPGKKADKKESVEDTSDVDKVEDEDEDD